MAEQHVLRCGKRYGRFDVYRKVAATKKLVALKKKNPHAKKKVPLTKNAPPSRKVSHAKRKGLPTNRPQMQKSSQVRKKSQQVVKSKKKHTTGKARSSAAVPVTVSKYAVKPREMYPLTGYGRSGLRGEPFVCWREVKESMDNLTSLLEGLEDLKKDVNAWKVKRVVVRRALKDGHYTYNVGLSSRARTTFKYRAEGGQSQVFHLTDHASNVDTWQYSCKLLGIPESTVKAWDSKFGGDAGRCWEEAMSTWLAKGISTTRYPASWCGMIDLLNDSSSPRMSAHSLRHALHLIPSQHD